MTGITAAFCGAAGRYGVPSWGNITAANDGNNSGSAFTALSYASVRVRILGFTAIGAVSVTLYRNLNGVETSLGAVTGDTTNLATFTHPVNQSLYWRNTISGTVPGVDRAYFSVILYANGIQVDTFDVDQFFL